MTETAGLTDLDRALLEFELQRWVHPGAKEAAVRSRFDMSVTRYYQRLNALIDQPAAALAYPSLVLRLQRVRDARRARRAA